MTKIILSLLLILLSVPAFAQGIYLPVASGTVTQANMKISAVDGTSFIDFTAANVLTGKTGNLLVVRDSSGRAIQGFIKAAGTGETFSDALAGWNFTSGWINHSNSTINDANTFTTTSSGGIRSNDFLTELACYRVNFTANASSGSVGLLGYSTSLSTGYGSGLIVDQPVVNFYNTTAPSFTSYYLRNNVAATTDVTSLKAEQVLTPSATGVTIVSTKGGATFNWAQKNSAFNYNDSSGYTYQIYKVLNAPVVDSGACANANATINLSAGSAAWSCTGIDDSAYQNTDYILSVSDYAGRSVVGYYNKVTPGEIVSDRTGAIQSWFYKHPDFATDGNYVRKVYYAADGEKTWTEVASRLGDETVIRSLTVFNNKLYGGTDPNGKLYEWNGTNTWVEVAAKLGSETRIYSLAVFNNKLYGGTYPNGKLYEWNGTNAWVEVAARLGDETGIYSLAVFNNKLYGGTSPNGKLYEWNGTDAWVEVAPKLGAETSIYSLAVFNNKLYGGTDPNGKLYEWNGTNAWTEVASTLGAGTRIWSLTVFNNKLYGGTYPNGNLYEWNGTNAWAEVAAKLGSETIIFALTVFNNKLYGSTYPNGKLHEWNGTNAWVEVAARLGDETGIYSLAVFNNKLYGGTSPNGKLYRRF